MTVTVFIRYQLDPFKRAMFESIQNAGLASSRMRRRPAQYWMPHEGTNNIAFALISFESRAAYEGYRAHSCAAGQERHDELQFCGRRTNLSWRKSGPFCAKLSLEAVLAPAAPRHLFTAHQGRRETMPVDSGQTHHLQEDT